MAKVQYAFITSATAPYCRLLKFVEGVGEVVPSNAFAFTKTPVALSVAEFSADARYLLAATQASSTAPLRMWKRNKRDKFDEITLPDMASAKTINSIIWLTDTRIMFSDAVNGIWDGTLDRNTDTITWVQITNTPNFRWLMDAPDDRTFWAIGAGGYACYFRNTISDAITVVATASIEAGNFDWVHGDIDPVSGLGMCMSVAVRGANDLHIRRGTNTSYRNYQVAGMVYDSIDVAQGTRFTKWSRRGNILWALSEFAPYLRFIQTVYGSTSILRWLGVAQLSPYPTFPAFATSCAEILREDGGGNPDDLLLVAVDSNTISTGRIRGFSFNHDLYTFTELPEISDLFDDWSAIPAYVVSSNRVETGTVKVYSAVADKLFNQSYDLTNLKLALLNSSSIFDASHTTLAQVLGANEVYGGGWPQGGINLPDAVFSFIGTDYALRLVSDFPATPTSSAVTFRSAVIYDNTHVDKQVLCFIDFGDNRTSIAEETIMFKSLSNTLFKFTTD